MLEDKIEQVLIENQSFMGSDKAVTLETSLKNMGVKWYRIAFHQNKLLVEIRMHSLHVDNEQANESTKYLWWKNKRGATCYCFNPYYIKYGEE